MTEQTPLTFSVIPLVQRHVPVPGTPAYLTIKKEKWKIKPQVSILRCCGNIGYTNGVLNFIYEMSFSEVSNTGRISALHCVKNIQNTQESSLQETSFIILWGHTYFFLSFQQGNPNNGTIRRTGASQLPVRSFEMISFTPWKLFKKKKNKPPSNAYYL